MGSEVAAPEHRLNSRGSQDVAFFPAQGRGLCLLPSAGGILTTEPPGKPLTNFFFFFCMLKLGRETTSLSYSVWTVTY